MSVYTVARELGHGGEALVRRVYGHLGDVRHRGEVVEYRVDQAVALISDERRRAAYEERVRAVQVGG